MWGFLKRKKRTIEDLVEYPRISRIKVHPIPCHTCGKPLEHNDLVVWSEKKSGWKSELSHAQCVVFIRHPDSSTTKLSGETVRTRRGGGILDPLPKGALLLTESEWQAWSKLPLED